MRFYSYFKLSTHLISPLQLDTMIRAWGDPLLPTKYTKLITSICMFKFLTYVYR